MGQEKKEDKSIKKFLKQIIFIIAISYLIWSIFVTILSVFTADKIECRYLECNLIKFFNMENIRDLNNISKQLNNTLYFGECYYKGERINCGNLKVSIFKNNNVS